MAAESVTLHSSWKGIIASSMGSMVVLAAGLLVVLQVGWRVIPTFTMVFGCCLVLIVVFDYPVATSIDSEGVTRRMVLRRQRLTWDHIDYLARSRPGLISGLRKLAHGGLVAVVGRRRYLLTDRCECLEEYDALRRVVETVSPSLTDKVPAPPSGSVPTWWYRRAKWAPDSARDR